MWSLFSASVHVHSVQSDQLLNQPLDEEFGCAKPLDGAEEQLMQRAALAEVTGQGSEFAVAAGADGVEVGHPGAEEVRAGAEVGQAGAGSGASAGAAVVETSAAAVGAAEAAAGDQAAVEDCGKQGVRP